MNSRHNSQNRAAGLASRVNCGLSRGPELAQLEATATAVTWPACPPPEEARVKVLA